VQTKKDDDEEDSASIALQLRCEFLANRIQYLFNFIMNYRSRYSHNIKNRKNKFLLEEHFESYNQLCGKLKEAKALMDKMELVPVVRKFEQQSMRFVNNQYEKEMEIEDDLLLAQTNQNITP